MIPLFLYRLLIIVLTPFLWVLLGVRRLRGKEDTSRLRERLGFPNHPRPAGRLVWIHGASVGECLSFLPLIHQILAADSSAHVMVTSGTLTSARLMAQRLPARAFHQFIPVDFWGAAHRFARHFKPDCVLWFESDFWPNMMAAIAARKVPFVLLNGRVSDKSFERWQRFRWFIAPLLRKFTLAFGQTDEDARRLKALGAREVLCVGNIKYAAPPAPFDPEELNRLSSAIGDRPCWCGACTHPGEEEIMADIHVKLKGVAPRLLTVCVPRHPHRAEAVKSDFQKRGLTVAQRSADEPITAQTDVYLADTIGEMGLLYQLAPIAFVGGSLVVFGGQNMLEPMRLARVVMVGPHTFNFKKIVAEAKQAGALIEVKDADDLSNSLLFFLKHADARAPIAEKARQMALSETGVLDRIYRVLQEKAGCA